MLRGVNCLILWKVNKARQRALYLLNALSILIAVSGMAKLTGAKLALLPQLIVLSKGLLILLLAGLESLHWLVKLLTLHA